jgi:hypothetical protein
VEAAGESEEEHKGYNDKNDQQGCQVNGYLFPQNKKLLPLESVEVIIPKTL